MENAYTKTPAEALRQFQVEEQQGLSAQQVQSAREKHGKNGMSASSQRPPTTNTRDSAARRPADTHLGAHPGAVQGPAGHHLARLGSSVVRTCPL